MKSARGEYDSVYGKIVSDWRYAEGFHLDVVIPPNTTATIYLPAGGQFPVVENGKKIETKPGPDGAGIVKVGSGTYHFCVEVF